MSEKKRGLLGRLFGAKEDAPAPAPAGDEAEATAAPEVEATALEQDDQPGEAAAMVPSPRQDEGAPQPKQSWLKRLRSGLSRSSSALTGGISAIFTKRKLDADTLEELEDILIQADLGVETAMAITGRLAQGRYDKEISVEDVRTILAEEVEKVLEPTARPLEIDLAKKPHVILVVGVNGTGKTTTIGKLSAKFAAEGRKVMLAAGDTFRAAAVEQLKIWGARTGAEVIARDTGADAAGLVFDAMKEAADKGVDVLLIDTAGRLQNRAELMAELEKVVRVIRKYDAEAPHSVLLTLDATTGQNAMNQVEIFGKTAGVTGLVMTKLDGTARGGILVAIAARHKMPVHFIGVGEGVDDLEPFTARDFARAIAEIDA
ncbi:signal recognition particle-docking protein FtsY [Stappia sp. F7233]|uniref:Signal recognition particle receptor FtsY n=1 Tax=Stappia albiluteola TaxID=2758565 RepID=A0A839AI52_9HYPH|nr:signal recognition particle-docking protein FtsY [Stappia albiluteola]MBA5778602.1 signal recognition particle-docking protein FtsY [Stappia albiluteola]